MNVNIGKKVIAQSAVNFVPIPEGEFSTPIKIDPEKLFIYGSIFQSDGAAIASPKRLFSYEVESIEGVPVSQPENKGWVYSDWNSGVRTDERTNHPYTYFTVDLGDLYHLDYAYAMKNGNGAAGMAIFSSQTGGTWTLLNDDDLGWNPEVWVKREFGSEGIAAVRFIRVGLTSVESDLTGFVLYGRLAKELLIKGEKFKRFVPVRTLEETIGTNGFAFDDAKLMSNISVNSRFYIESDWMIAQELREQASGLDITPDEISLRLQTSHMGNFDQLLQDFRNNNHHVNWTMVGSPLYLREFFVQGVKDLRPVDPGKTFTGLTDTVVPENYSHMARIFYILAARYGRNKQVDTSMINWGNDDPQVGLDLIYIIEPGNEYEGPWRKEGWWAPEEMAAYLSAVYDGHMGTMGPGFGIKIADPSMLVSIPAFAVSDSIGYLYDMILWSNEHRGVNNLPFDVINIHHYNSTYTNQAAGQGAYGQRPEVGSMIEICKLWSDFRDINSPACEVWITETGYDEHLGGGISPNFPTWEERRKYKAYWLIRTMIATKAFGLDIANQYWFSSVGMERSDERNMQEWDPSLFPTCQYMDVYTEGEFFYGYNPLVSYWYMYHFKKEVEGYSFLHFVKVDGVTQTNENIVDSSDSRVWAMAMWNYSIGEGMLVLWLGSQGFQSLSLGINLPEEEVQIIQIDDAEIRQGDSGFHYTMSSNPSGSSRRLNLTINECPILIKTINVGTTKPIPANNIRTQKLSTGETLIVWKDENLLSYNVQIERSSSESGPYTTIYTGPTRNAQYVDTTTTALDHFFYKVTLLPNS